MIFDALDAYMSMLVVRSHKTKTCVLLNFLLHFSPVLFPSAHGKKRII
jgi:hypothetical protein